jgi:hypothetical protein
MRMNKMDPLNETQTLVTKAYLEGAHECFIHRHHAPSVVKLSTVVGGGEQRDQLTLGKELVAIFHHLHSTKKL